MIRTLSIALGLGCVALAACDAADPDGPQPWEGSLRSGLERMESLTDDGAFDDALAVADRIVAEDGPARARAWLDGATRGASEAVFGPVDRLLDAVGVATLTPADRGEVEFARAVVLLRSAAGTDAPPEDASGRMSRAIDAFGRARAAGGPARLDAVYDLGTLDLMRAETLRDTIPEISGGPPPPPAGGSQKDDAAKDDEDPLDRARRAYLAARSDFVERLQLGADDDTRANVELVLRRLRELDDIEKQREEQQQDQEPQEGDEGDPSEDDSEENEDENESEDEQEDQESEESESDENEDQPQDPDEPQDPEDEEPEEQEPDEPEEGDEEEDESDPEDAEPEGEPEELLMTDEEQKRVMERNREYQENGEMLRRLLRMRRKVPTKRDW